MTAWIRRMEAGRRDVLLTIVVWAACSVAMVVAYWHRIATLTFPDPDDAMRMKQVLDLLSGQSWWDITQYAVDPPHGTDMHWSRLVDVPLILLLRPLLPILGRDDAMRVAGTVATLIPMLPAMLAMSFAGRRLVAPSAGALVALFMWLAPMPSQMWDPMRVDHHGWQIALACVMLAATTARSGMRSGMAAGAAGAASLAIGMENAPFIAVAAGAYACRWVRDDRDLGLRGYASAMLALLPLGYGLFAPWGNSHLTCDALTPVWTSDGMIASAILLAVTLPTTGMRGRVAGIAAAALAAGAWHAIHSPGCILPVEHISPEARRLWFSTNAETMSAFRVPGPLLLAFTIQTAIATVGVAMGIRRDGVQKWAVVAAMMALATIEGSWRIRGTPIAQIMDMPGSAFIAWAGFATTEQIRPLARRLAALLVVVLLASGSAIVLATDLGVWIAGHPRTVLGQRACIEGTRIERLSAIKGDLVFADLYESPRISLLTTHRTLAGPYHRDADSIVRLLKEWKDPPEEFRAEARRRGIGIVVACPEQEAPVGKDSFQDQLFAGKLPWMKPIPVPGMEPLKAWKVEN